MGRIQKGFALTIAICGVVYLISGLISSVCGWVLASKLTDGFSISASSSSGIQFGVYWWGGCSLFIPGILGIVAACTRNICAMVAFLIFNIIGMLAAIGCTIYVAIIMVVWMPIAALNKENKCLTLLNTCTCSDPSEYFKNIYSMNSPCEEMSSVEPLLFGIVIGVALCGFVAFISSYVSCCSLCNTEQGSVGMVVQQPPAMVFMATTQGNQSYHPQQPYFFNQQMPYGDGASVYPPAPVASYDNFSSNDKLKLIDNRIV